MKIFDRSRVRVGILAFILGLMSAALLIAAQLKPSSERIYYIRDERNGLCFAAVPIHDSRGYRNVSIAHVPCSAAERVWHPQKQ